MRAGFAALRRGAGDDAFLLGCGVPLSNVVGLVDASRIGPDVAPVWALDPADEMVPGYLGIQPATSHAFTNTLTRSFMHRRLWLNDPDCLMLRTADTALAPAAAAPGPGPSGCRAAWPWSRTTWPSSAPRHARLLDEVVGLGRAADDAACAGLGARCPDLLEHGHARPPHLGGRSPRGRPGRRDLHLLPGTPGLTAAGRHGARGPGSVGSAGWTPGADRARRTPSGGQ